MVSAQDPDGIELVLEPDAHPAAKPFKAALLADGIPFTSFAVDDVAAEHRRLSGLGVRFTQPPVAMGQVTTAVLDDTCGNLIQIMQRHWCGERGQAKSRHTCNSHLAPLRRQGRLMTARARGCAEATLRHEA